MRRLIDFSGGGFYLWTMHVPSKTAEPSQTPQQEAVATFLATIGNAWKGSGQEYVLGCADAECDAHDYGRTSGTYRSAHTKLRSASIHPRKIVVGLSYDGEKSLYDEGLLPWPVGSFNILG